MPNETVKPKTKGRSPSPAQTAFEKDSAKLTTKFNEAIASALALFQNRDSEKQDGLINIAFRKIASYLGVKQNFEANWTVDGTKKANIQEAKPYSGRLFLRTFREEDKWIAVVIYFHHGERVTMLRTEPYAIRVEATDAIKPIIEAAGVGERMDPPFRIFYEGDLKYETEMKKLGVLRDDAISKINALIFHGGRKDIPASEIDKLFSDSSIALCRYVSRRILCEAQWLPDGTWIGRKKKIRKDRRNNGEVVIQAEESTVEKAGETSDGISV